MRLETSHRNTSNRMLLSGKINLWYKLRGQNSFEPRGLAWEASTLPLSYTRSVALYYAPKSI